MADEKKVEKKEELPPEVKEMIQKSEEAVELQKKESERIAKENDELKKEIATEREIRLKKEFLQKAEAIPFVAGEKEKMAEFLKGLDEEAEKYITGVLATANAQLEKSELFKELGSGNAASLDVVKRVEKAAEEEVAKDGKLTKEQAIVKVLESKPELYVEYEKQLQNANK